MIYALLLTPLITGLVCYFLKKKRAIEIVNAVGGGIVLLISIILGFQVFIEGPIADGIWYVDGLSIYFIFLIALIGFFVSLYSVAYLDHEFASREIDLPKFRSYYFFLHIFISTMILVCISNNLGVLWAAIEATTLASAFLVAFYNKKTSIEATWKYIILCSAGITIALLGTIFLYLGSVAIVGEVPEALNWTTIMGIAGSLDPQIVKLAFVLIFIGFGTKLGLVPMHTWLPDAHSQAPTPISALLSGVLLNCALYGVLRYHIITTKAIGVGFSNMLFISFGILTVVIASLFILIVKDYKRMLAYSSIKHMGLISLGFGIGGPIGLFGSLFHIMNHSLTKSLLFFGAGNILMKYGTRDIEKVRGVGKVMPVTATFFMIGIFALVGCPPFSPFVSEISILSGMVGTQNYLVAIIVLVALAFTFAGMTSRAGKMISGEPLEQSKLEESEGSHRSGAELQESRNPQTPPVISGESSRLNLVVMGILIIIIVCLGVALPTWLSNIFTNISNLF